MTKEMTLNEYVEWTQKTCASLENADLDDIHMLFGMATEVGELMDIYKKYLAYKKPKDIINVKEEVGDVLYYIASFCRMNGFDLQEIIETNVKKLESRYPEKFTEYHANNRDLEKERRILAAEKIIKKYESPNQSVLGNDRTSRVSNEEKDLEIKQHPPFP